MRIPELLGSISSVFNPGKKENVQFLECVFPFSVNEDTPFLLDDPVLCAMAEKYKRTPALIALRYQLQRGIVVLAKSFNEERIRENMQVMKKPSIRDVKLHPSYIHIVFLVLEFSNVQRV